MAQKVPIRNVASQMDCSPSTISTAKRKLELAELETLISLTGLSDQKLLDIYYGQGRAVQSSHDVIITRQNRRTEVGDLTLMLPEYERYADMVIDEHVKKQFTFALYRRECMELGRQSVCRTSFMSGLNYALKEQLGPADVYMRQFHDYGEEAAIDYCGDLYELLDAEGNKKSFAICVLAWAASNYVYAEFIDSQSTLNTCNVVAHAVMHWQCVPRFLVCDNAKSMVIKHEIGREPIFNDTFAYNMHKLGMLINANNPYSPSGKSYVELSVRLVQDRVLPLLKMSPLPMYLPQANAELMSLIDSEINNSGFRNNGKGTSRRMLFEKFERLAALKLPDSIPEYREHVSFLHSGRDHTVLIKEHRYSVPWRHANEDLHAELSASRVYIIGDEGVIAEHQRNDCAGATILPEHMKPEHRAVFEKRAKFKDPEDIIAAAALISPVLKEFCERYFAGAHTVEQANCPITIIKRYQKDPEQQALYTEALKRVMGKDVVSWSSYAFSKEVNNIKKEIAGAGEAHVMGNSSVVMPDQSQCCLHGADAFTAPNKDHTQSPEHKSK